MTNGLDYPFLFKTFFVALSGVPIALLVTIVALLFALPTGFAFALSSLNNVPFIKQFVRLYISFVRGTPVIVQIFVVYSSIPLLLDIFFTTNNINVNVYDVHPIWYAFIIFAFNTTAILIEVFRSALSAVDRSQIEAAYAVGLNSVQAYRRIVIPQALIVAMPNLCTATINLVKATSLGYAISLHEITLKAKVAANVNYNYVEAYIDIFIVYLILCMVIEFLFRQYEKKLSKYKMQPSAA